MGLPERFCWTRFGTEAGQSSFEILSRKEWERQSEGGLFLWGIGNAIGPGVKELVRYCPEPEVLFSPIKSPPRPVDVRPRAVVAWTIGETLDAETYTLPKHSLVTSRYDATSPRKCHYALVCFSDQPLSVGENGPTLAFDSLSNLLSGRQIGASQVTAVVERKEPPAGARRYLVAFRARLIWPYFIRLWQPISLPYPPWERSIVLGREGSEAKLIDWAAPS